jgi:hypothetical protein
MKKNILYWLVINAVLSLLYYLSFITGQGWFVLANICLCIELCARVFCMTVVGCSLLLLDRVKAYQVKEKSFEKNKQAILNICQRAIPKYLSIPIEIAWVITLFNYDFVFGATVSMINLVLLVAFGRILKIFKEKMYGIEENTVTNSQK